jgi:hypothetical protein
MQTTPRHVRRTFPIVLAAFACLALAVPALAAAPKGSYKGASSQKGPVSLKASGKKVKKFTIAYKAPCNDGRMLTSTFTFNPVDRKGTKFSAKGSTTDTIDGAPAVANLKLTGKFNKAAKKATGTFSISWETPNAAFDGITTCKSGKVKYTVKK